MASSDESRSGLRQLLPTPQGSQHNERGRLVTFLVVLLLGMLITWFAYDLVATNAANDLRSDFEQEAGQIEAKLQSQFDLSFEYLLSIPPFFQASDDVSREDFRRFVSDALKRHPSIHTFEYLPRVAAQDRETFQAAAKIELADPTYTIHAVDLVGDQVPLPTLDNYFPVFYGEPPIEGVLGVDLLSHPEQGSYVERACMSALPVATHPLSLIEDPKDVLSVIAFAPIREPSTEISDTCNGMAVLVIRVRPIVEAALEASRLSEFELSLHDNDSGEDGKLVYKNYPGIAYADSHSNWPVASRRIRFADQAWDFKISPAFGSEFALRRARYWILLLGFALSALAAYSLSATFAIGGLRKQVDEALELGQYRLGKKLGEGGMGVVYEAQHRMLARPAAIKLIQLDPDNSNSQSSTKQSLRLSRFEKEAKATARLESPHTISVYDFGKTPDGEFYYVMELLDGNDLSTLVKQCGPIPPARMIHLVRQVCLSLAEAHQAGLIHRDIKPANIFVCRYALEYDFVKVLDFGLVKSSEAETSLEITQPGSLIGTPAFIAPEMLVNDSVDGRTDIYSLGCVMFWLLTGKAPFAGQTATAVMAKHLTQKPASLRTLVGAEVSDQLDGIIASCLAKKPDERPATARQLEQLLAACAAEAPWTQADAKQCWLDEREIRQSSHEHDTYRDQAAEITTSEDPFFPKSAPHSE